jgi:hypothetical protein
MPRLPTSADLGERPIPRANTRQLPVQATDPKAEALQYAGRKVMQLGDEMLREEERADFLRAEAGHNDVKSAFVDLAEGADGYRKKRGADAINTSLAGDYLGRFDHQVKKISQGLANSRQRKKLEELAGLTRMQLGQDLLRHIGSEGEHYAKEVYDNGLKTEAGTAAVNWSQPEAIATSLVRMQRLVGQEADRSGWSPEKKAYEEQRLKSEIHATVVGQALSFENYEYGRNYFEGVRKDMDPETAGRVARALEGKEREIRAEDRQRRALFRAELSDRVADATAAYLTTGNYDDAPTQEEFRKAYDDPEEADKRFHKFEQVRAVGGAVQEAVLANPAEQRALLEKFTPNATSGFKDGQERYEILATSIAKINKQREDDPAFYLVRYMPSVEQAFRALTTAPAEVQTQRAEDYARQVRTAGAELGIENPALLPKAYARQMVGQFYDQKEGGEPAAARILTERAKWGSAWPDVWRQLSPDLPGAAYVIGAGMNLESGRRLAEVSTVKLDDLRASLPTQTSPKDVTDAVRGQLNEAILSFADQPGSDKLAATLLDSAERLALRYMATGRDQSDAAKQAADEVFNERYNYVTVMENRALIPVPFADPGGSLIRVPLLYDGDNVESGLRLAHRDLAGKQPRLDESTWVTLPDDSGVALTWMGGLAERPDGTPIVYGWDDLLNRAATAERATADEFRRIQATRPFGAGAR